LFFIDFIFKFYKIILIEKSIARHKIHHDQHHHHSLGNDYVAGHFDPRIQLGKVIIVEYEPILLLVTGSCLDP
jgi:hypothetical protein